MHGVGRCRRCRAPIDDHAEVIVMARYQLWLCPATSGTAPSERALPFEGPVA